MGSLFAIEPRIKAIIDQGCDAIRNDIDKIDELFAGAEQQLIDNFKDYLAKTAVRVVLGYPRDETQIPCISITLANFNVAANTWGDIFEKVASAATFNSHAEEIKRGELQTNIYRASIWTISQELTLALFYLTHHILINNKGLLVEVGVRETTFGGGDLEPAPQYFPTFVFLRSLTISALAETVLPVYAGSNELRKISDRVIAN